MFLNCSLAHVPCIHQGINRWCGGSRASHSCSTSRERGTHRKQGRARELSQDLRESERQGVLLHSPPWAEAKEGERGTLLAQGEEGRV